MRNRCKCLACGDIIESMHRHDFVTCKCGAIFTDGGTDYVRRGGKDLSLIENVPDDESEEVKSDG
jgi:DNA-directed RNA polymerase subunit RPC12/RpoP